MVTDRFQRSISGGKNVPPIVFFVPCAVAVRTVPLRVEDYWAWHVDYLDHRKGAISLDGPLVWTVLSYLQLRDRGLPVRLVSECPGEGIVVTHADFLEGEFPGGRRAAPSARRMVVAIKQERLLSKELVRWGHFWVVQNRSDTLRRWPLPMLIRTFAVAHWPQPALIPRDKSRGPVFENAAFVGNRVELHSDFHDWGGQLSALGLSWKIVPRAEWNDFSRIDVVVAVRPDPGFPYPNRPGSRLVNAWAAGVPAVLGPELYYRRLRRSPLDYLEAKSAKEALACLERLRNDRPLREDMAEHGRERAREFTPEKIAGHWERFFLDTAVPCFRAWERSALTRRLFDLRMKLFSDRRVPYNPVGIR